PPLAGEQAQPAGARPRSRDRRLPHRRAHDRRGVRRLRARRAARGPQPRLPRLPPLRAARRRRVRAIDCHVHPSTQEWVDAMGPFHEATERFFRTSIPVRSVDEMADEFRADDLMAVLLAWDAGTATGLPPVTTDLVPSCVERHPDVFIGFASVDPWRGKEAQAELRRAVTDLGLRGLKLHPSVQAFAPDDTRFYDL